MRHLLLVFWVISSVVIFFGCQEEGVLTPELSQSEQATASLAKPAPKLVGETDTKFTGISPAFWVGTIDFGGDQVYGLAFTSEGAPTVYGQSSHFAEEFIIYKLDGEWNIPEDVYLKGWNEGVVSNVNNKFRANGEVTEAYVPFAEWLGCKVHVSGVVVDRTDEFGEPETAAIGTLQIN